MDAEEYREYVSLIFDNYLRKLLYGGTILVSIFLLVRYINEGDKPLESVMVVLGVLIFGELFLQTFRWLFSKAPLFFKAPTAPLKSQDNKKSNPKKKKTK